MKNRIQTQPTRHNPRRRLRPQPARIMPQPDPLQEEIVHRRLYTDFLALALYPGMRVPSRDTAA
ncbi:MAG TPA: hypothetical protein VHN79_14625 [Lacunisphaera sp.]|nr:hypothetical protein [Lacunisphaera sp.]